MFEKSNGLRLCKLFTLQKIMIQAFVFPRPGSLFTSLLMLKLPLEHRLIHGRLLGPPDLARAT